MTRFLYLAWAERWLLLEAIWWLGVARAAILTLPFRWLMRGLQQQMGTTSPLIDEPVTLAQRQQIAWALAVTSRRTPWWSNCLTQALAGTIMLRRRKLSSTLYLGVYKGNAMGKDQPASFSAHAWLRSGTLILTGDGQLEQFAVLTTFSDGSSPLH